MLSNGKSAGTHALHMEATEPQTAYKRAHLKQRYEKATEAAGKVVL